MESTSLVTGSHYPLDSLAHFRLNNLGNIETFHLVFLPFSEIQLRPLLVPTALPARSAGFEEVEEFFDFVRISTILDTPEEGGRSSQDGTYFEDVARFAVFVDACFGIRPVSSIVVGARDRPHIVLLDEAYLEPETVVLREEQLAGVIDKGGEMGVDTTGDTLGTGPLRGIVDQGSIVVSTVGESGAVAVEGYGRGCLEVCFDIKRGHLCRVIDSRD